MKKHYAILPLLGLVVLGVLMIGRPARAASLPEVVYLGEGADTYQTDRDSFVVKRFGPFRFDLEPGPTYEASSEERVWEQSGANAAPPAVWEEEIDLGPVQAGCVVNYIGVDDDMDGRRNAFFVNGTQVELISEGMVFRGEFTVQEDGDLILIAEDSVGGWINICEEIETPTATPTSTATNTPIATDTATPDPSATITNTPPPTASTTPGPIITISPTSTMPPPTSPPATAESTATPTRKPREDACVRINFDVSGDEAVRGLYIVQETGGKLLASWYALDGWKDSGWFKDIDISHENVYVQVLYYPGPDTAPTHMTILNHAPDSPFGWMSWGVCHALEVAWPD